MKSPKTLEEDFEKVRSKISKSEELTKEELALLLYVELLKEEK